MESVLLWIKYLVLILLAVLCFTGVYASTKGSSPWEVFSMLHTGNLKLSAMRVGGNLPILILIGMVPQERFFCRFLCPLGAVFSLLPVFPFFVLKRDRENCAKGCKGCNEDSPGRCGTSGCSRYRVHQGRMLSVPEMHRSLPENQYSLWDSLAERK